MVQFCKEGRKEKGWVVCPSLPQDSCNLFLGVLGVITTAGGGVEKGKDNYDVSCPENNSFLLFSSLPPTASIFFFRREEIETTLLRGKKIRTLLAGFLPSPGGIPRRSNLRDFCPGSSLTRAPHSSLLRGRELRGRRRRGRGALI